MLRDLSYPKTCKINILCDYYFKGQFYRDFAKQSVVRRFSIQTAAFKQLQDWKNQFSLRIVFLKSHSFLDTRKKKLFRCKFYIEKRNDFYELLMKCLNQNHMDRMSWTILYNLSLLTFSSSITVFVMSALLKKVQFLLTKLTNFLRFQANNWLVGHMIRYFGLSLTLFGQRQFFLSLTVFVKNTFE